MTPEEDKIFRAFSECQLAPLEGVPTYEYMANLNVYLNSCSSVVACKLGCGMLGYLVLMAQPAVFFSTPPGLYQNLILNIENIY